MVPVSWNQKDHLTDERKQSSGLHTVRGLPSPYNGGQEVPLTVEYNDKEHQLEEPRKQKRIPSMSVEYTNGEYVFEGEKHQRITLPDSSSFCNVSEKLSICEFVCVVAECRNKTLHGTVTARQSPEPVHTCNNANRQPFVSPSTTRERGGMQKEEKLEYGGEHVVNQRSIPCTEIKEHPHTVFIQLEEQEVSSLVS